MLNIKNLYTWCSIKTDELERHEGLKIKFRMVQDSHKMGVLMARELVDEVKKAIKEGRQCRAIVPADRNHGIVLLQI